MRHSQTRATHACFELTVVVFGRAVVLTSTVFSCCSLHYFTADMASKRPGTPLSGNEKKRKNKVLTINEKLDLLKKLDSGTSVRKLCEMFDVGSSTVYDLKKQKTKLREFYA